MFAKLAVIVAAALAVAHAEDVCPPSAIGLLAPVANEPSVPLCTKESGFSLIPPTGLPTEEQYVKMCASENCGKVIEAVKKTNPGDCILDLSFMAPGVKFNVKKLVDGYPAKCASLKPTPSTTTPAPGPGPNPTPTTTTKAPGPGPSPTTPAPTSVKPSC